MIIIPVDDQNNLFLVEDVYPQDLLDKIQQEDFWDYDWELQEGQPDWARRRLHVENTVLADIDPYLNSFRQFIADQLNIEFKWEQLSSNFWLDYPPYTCVTHLDNNELPIAMQIYLLDCAGSEHGTVFYNKDKTVRYEFPYKVNTGYLMLNGPEQYHGVPTKLNKGELRLSSYTYFGEFTHK